ncbi:MAG: hypothetical protein ACOZFS_11615 [Thermodesulfobacteriota bacterium]
MKRFILALVAMIVWALPGNIITCGAQQVPPDLKPLWPAEEEVLKQVAAGKAVDLRARFGEDDKNRKIRGTFLEALFTAEGIPGLKIHRRGVVIKNAVITTDLDLRSAAMQFEVKLEECIFRENVNFQDCFFKYNLQILKSQFDKQASFLDLEVIKKAYFNETVFKSSANFKRAKIGTEFSLKKTRFEGKETTYFNGMNIGWYFDGEGAFFQGPMEFQYVQMGGDVKFSDSEFHGGVYFAASNIKGNLMANGAKFLNENDFASFYGLKVGRHAGFDQAQFKGPVDFERADIGLIFSAVETKFLNKKTGDETAGVFLRNMNVGTVANFAGAMFNTNSLNFEGTSIGEKFYAPKARFECPRIDFSGMKVRGEVYFENVVFQGEADFSDADIVSGNFQITKDWDRNEKMFQGPVIFNRAHFANLTLSGTKQNILIIPKLSLVGTVVERRLTLQFAEITILEAPELRAKGQTTLSDVEIMERLDLTSADLATINISKNVTWPSKQVKLLVGGLTYRDIPSYYWNDLIRLIEDSQFDPKNYRQLEEYFKQRGQEDLATEVYIKMNDRELEQTEQWYWKPLNWIYWLFYGWPTGYGSKKTRVLYISLGIMLLGAVIFNPKYLKSEHSFANVKNPALLRLLLSVDIFLPKVPQKLAEIIKFSGLDLGIAQAWQPPTRALWVFCQFQKLIGFVIVIAFFPTLYKAIFG